MLKVRVARAAFATSGSLKKLTQHCILKNKEFFYNFAILQRENPFSRICKWPKNRSLFIK
jgi:hypothetical protein